ncbi:squalene/phytoene synthase family protein [Acetobacter sp. UBA5411]|uniref:squalene/phytoene synthase family protein n=1 Tax=Acetobacter sp. UBA5411 TaxID=1945905 RepID=UPI0025C5A9A7|nr:squalene/phytoene synthase family protein [Acetobacter sp. UBA5411]
MFPDSSSAAHAEPTLLSESLSVEDVRAAVARDKIDPWRAPDVSSGKGQSDENFPVGSVLFAPAMRSHVHAYYDFARFSDDVTDSDRLTPEEKVARLDAMEDIVHGRAQAPDRKDARSAARVREMLLRTGLPFEVATDLLVAFREDAVKSRYASQAELDLYCRYSANPVGRFLLGLHGESDRTFPASDALCTSLQILNHLQDCQKDLLLLKRCYVPLDLLEAQGLGVEAVLENTTSPSLRRVFDILLDETDRLNEEALGLLRHVRDRRMRMYCGAVVRLAHLLAARLRVGDPLAERVALTKADFARAAVAALGSWKN